MHFRLAAITVCCFQLASAQRADTLQSLINNILPEFEYKQELKNCVVMSGGEFMSGLRMGDDSLSLGTPIKKTVQPFLISKFEVRNKDYRSFVNYVRDSIAHSLLGHWVETGNRKKIFWDTAINWKDKRLEPMMISEDDRIYARLEIDPGKIIYRSSIGEEIPIYPDTLCWIRDFAYSYNEPMTKWYFSHPAFGNYPVVGINQVQAMAYCDWKTGQWNNALMEEGQKKCKLIVRLPSSEEWEFAAQSAYPITVRDLTQTKSYKMPMGGMGINYGYRYNFGRYYSRTNEELKSYYGDGFFYTAPANTYNPDANGLYNLFGNVAECTSSRGSYQPVYDKDGRNGELAALKKKYPNSPFTVMDEKAIDAFLRKQVIVKGGSWSDDDFYLQPGVNQYFAPDATHCFIGFRIAVEFVVGN
jgi:sulfatase modifying factor 1